MKKVDVTTAGDIVALCYRGRERQAIPILELRLPDPPPAGWEWIEAYRRSARDMEQWLSGLDPAEHVALLLRVARGDGSVSGAHAPISATHTAIEH